MPRNRFVVAESVRYELSDGDWVEFKKRLNYGEVKRLTTSGLNLVGDMGNNPRYDLSIERFEENKRVIWLSAWSFANGKGRLMEITADNVGALEPETVAEIDLALAKHMGAMEDEKNARAPDTAPAAG